MMVLEVDDEKHTIRRWLIAENETDGSIVELLFRRSKLWMGYSSDGYGPWGAIGFDFPKEIRR